MVANELVSGRSIRCWQDDFGAAPPFRVDPNVLFVAFYAPAELSCFLALGWPLPARIVDLYTEFRAETNRLPLPIGRGLLGALSHHGISSVSPAEKKTMRDLVLRGGPWTEPNAATFSTIARATLTAWARSWSGCFRHPAHPPGLRSSTVARPIRCRGGAHGAHRNSDRRAHDRRASATTGAPSSWGLIADIDKDYGVFEGTTFKAGLFASWLDAEGIAWPRTHHRPPAARSRHLPRHG